MGQLVRVAMALLATACTERNPEYCGDGTCIDPAKPYCDIDGSFSGTAGTCIAVSCTPGEFETCRGDIALRCNAAGGNFESVQCPMGCTPAAQGCIECTMNAQCDASQVCDGMTGQCRGCVADDECDSRVCDAASATCLPESSIVYAAPNGSGTCSLSQPCSLMSAIVRAENATPTPIVRLLPGSYTTSATINVPTPEELEIVATGATVVVVGEAAFTVDSGARARIRNLTSTGEYLVRCGLSSGTGPASAFSMRDATLSTAGVASIAFEIQNCLLRLDNVDLTASSTILGTRNDSTFSADRFYVRGGGAALVGTGLRGHIQLVNSVLDDVDVALFFSDTTAPGSTFKVSFSTVVFSGTENMCNGTPSANVSAAFDNSILAVHSNGDVFQSHAACGFTDVLLMRQATPPSGTLVGDPRFANFGTRDFHLTAASPAVDASTAATYPDHDFDGVYRPQGGKPDLGAFELK